MATAPAIAQLEGEENWYEAPTRLSRKWKGSMAPSMRHRPRVDPDGAPRFLAAEKFRMSCPENRGLPGLAELIGQHQEVCEPDAFIEVDITVGVASVVLSEAVGQYQEVREADSTISVQIRK